MQEIENPNAFKSKFNEENIQQKVDVNAENRKSNKKWMLMQEIKNPNAFKALEPLPVNM